MKAQAKTINMLLYNGTLDGAIRIEDSNWNGELFSAPRDSVNELLKQGACNKYGVYLLLASDRVYVGQSSDLSRRLSQHLNGKDWWESAVIITTKEDSLNRSDIDYLENLLIDMAGRLKKLDSDNKKSGNPPKVDVFREVFLTQYLEEALFLMQLIGIRVFFENKEKRKKRKKPAIEISIPAINPLKEIPELPSGDLKIGAFVYTAMRNLEAAGYEFTEDQINEMCTPEWSSVHFHSSKAFMKRFIPGETDNKGPDGFVRYKSDPYTFGEEQVLITKEWYERQRKFFVEWYTTLK